MKRALAALVVALVATSAACAGDTKTVSRPAVERGESLIGDPDFSSSSANYLACDDCHSRTSDEGTRIFPGYPLENSATRPFWWGGYERQYLGAVDELPDLTRRAGRGLGVPERSARL